MIESQSPFKQILGHISNVSFMGEYDQSRRQRLGRIRKPSFTILEGVLFDEGGRERSVRDTEGVKASINYLGRFTILYIEECRTIEYLPTLDGRVWQFNLSPDVTQSLRDFVEPSEALQVIERALS